MPPKQTKPGPPKATAEAALQQKRRRKRKVAMEIARQYQINNP